MARPSILTWVIGLVVIVACQSREPTVFQLLTAKQTGIYFTNTITENDSMNVIDYAYLYNGGGVGIGDVNNDGQDDIFFAGNQVSSKLYLNKGGLQFEDITEASGTTTERWATGVAMVDINQDSWLDIYVSVASKFDSALSRNYFFINNGLNELGIPTFTDHAAKFGLDDAGYSTQAAFLDYDLDGDLDMYLLTNGMEDFSHNLARTKNTNGEGISTDKLFRNDSDIQSSEIRFADVSRQAGILIEGYGLGLGINDFNLDGYPDIYAANDFIANDLLWINNGDGTFTDRAGEYLKHQSHNGMGTDVSDFNNDGLVDIVVLDMLPEDNYRQKTMLGKPNFDRFQLNLHYDYTPQYVRNTLQLHNGFTPDGKLSFSEIGQLAGIHSTDWSWSALFADYDNDGYRDLLITNGYVKDVTNLDFISYLSASSQFGTEESKRSKSLELTDMLKEAKVHNYIYRNNGSDSSRSLLFTDVSEEWGMIQPSFSNGTAFADFDQDGDLDLVMNNINQYATIYENTIQQDGNHNFLRLKLQGPTTNSQGFQTRVTLFYQNEKTQYHTHTPYRGYKSTVENYIHFGLGNATDVDSLIIQWPDSSAQRLYGVKTNQLLSVSYKDASKENLIHPPSDSTTPFFKISDSLGIVWKHEDPAFNDFNHQPLLHRSFSLEGPGMAVGDVNGDGLEDFFVGGAKNQISSFFLQQTTGAFMRRDLDYHQERETADALLFDADQDGDLDLYVVHGGNEFNEGNSKYTDCLYRNDGKGSFTYDSTALPTYTTSGSCVAESDFDQDGDLDLFVGGRLIPHQYPLPASSYILENQNGTFEDVTNKVAPLLQEFGLVTDAIWTDFNQDQHPDLLIAGEWMPLTFLLNQNGNFTDITDQTGLANTSGWWHSLTSGDFDNDGDTDYLAGNTGLNTKYKASVQEPIQLYTKDYDGNGSIDPILTYFIQGEEFATHSRGQLIDQLVGMRKRFNTYDTYALASFENLFSDDELKDAYVLESTIMTSSYIENTGNNHFKISPLPLFTQVAPISDMAVVDVNQDGNLDILAVGNSYSPETQHGWFDASPGWTLLGDGRGQFHSISLTESGFFVDTNAKAIKPINLVSGEIAWLIANHADSLLVYGSNLPLEKLTLDLP